MGDRARSDEPVVHRPCDDPLLVERPYQPMQPRCVERERRIGEAVLEKRDDQLGGNAMRRREAPQHRECLEGAVRHETRGGSPVRRTP